MTIFRSHTLFKLGTNGRKEQLKDGVACYSSFNFATASPSKESLRYHGEYLAGRHGHRELCGRLYRTLKAKDKDKASYQPAAAESQAALRTKFKDS
jgi:hypothetical protein